MSGLTQLSIRGICKVRTRSLLPLVVFSLCWAIAHRVWSINSCAVLRAMFPVFMKMIRAFTFSLCEKSARRGPQPLDEVKPQIEASLKNKKKVEVAAGRLTEVMGQIKTGKSLEEAAAFFNLTVQTPQPFARAGFVPNVGSRNAFVGAAFRLSTGQTSEIVKTDRGAYILRLDEKQSVDEVASGKEALSQQVLSQKRQEVFTAWFTDLRENAEIVDNRHFFYANY